MALSLAHWDRSFSHIQPDQLHAGALDPGDFQVATAETIKPGFAFLILILDWCCDMIWPYRRAWTGLAAVWLGLIGVNFSMREASPSLAMKSSRPSLELVRAYFQGEGMLAEWINIDNTRVAEPAKPTLPTPRTERRPGNLKA